MAEIRKIYELSLKADGSFYPQFSTKLFLTNEQFEFFRKLMVGIARGLD